MGIRDKPIAPGSPWQNGFAERLIGSIRRECADHVVALDEGITSLHAEELGPDGYLGRTRTAGPEGADACNVHDALPRMTTDATETPAPASKTPSVL